MQVLGEFEAKFGLGRNIFLPSRINLSASATGLGSVTSASFNLTGVDVDELDFVVQPTNNVAGVTLGEVQVIEICRRSSPCKARGKTRASEVKPSLTS